MHLLGQKGKNILNLGRQTGIIWKIHPVCAISRKVHHFGNGKRIGGSADCAPLRRQHCKGIF